MSAELRTLIRSVTAVHPTTDNIADLAKFVAAATPAHQVMGFYTDALTDSVRAVLGEDRRHNLDGPQVEPQGSATQDSSDSPKVRARAAWWQRVLSDRYHVGHSRWIPLGDCTEADLAFCIEERETQIAGLRKQNVNFAYLISLLQTHGVTTVSQLPPQQSWPS